MDLGSLLPIIVGITLIVFLISLGLRIMRQPHVVGYILTGILIGSSGLDIVQDGEIVSNLGMLGVIMLLFFIGMQVSIPSLFKRWKVAIIGTLIQITLSVLFMLLLGVWLGWPLYLSIMLGFVISLSSTAVILKILEEWGEFNTRVGQNVVGILLVQDVLVIPMIVLVEFFGKQGVESGEILLSVIGGLLLLHLVIWIIRQKEVQIPFAHFIPRDHESQVLVALVLCFGLAMVSSMFGLSAALGAFVAGIVVSSTKQTRWVRSSLEPFRVVFVALFFIYVGLLMDFAFIQENILLIVSLVFLILILKTILNAGILRMLGDKWEGAVYGGALLSQIGEFSFLIGVVGWQAGIIQYYSYQLIVSIIALTLLLSPFWILMFKKILGHKRTQMTV